MLKRRGNLVVETPVATQGMATKHGVFLHHLKTLQQWNQWGDPSFVLEKRWSVKMETSPPFPRPWWLKISPIGRYFFIFREFIFLGKWTCLSSFHICAYVLLIIQLRSWEYIWTYFLFPAIDAVFAVPVNCNYSNWKCLSDSKTPPLIHGIRGTQYLNR